MIKTTYSILLSVFIVFISNTIVHSEETISEQETEIKLSMQRLYNLDFSEKEVIITNDLINDKNLIIKGYALKNPDNEKLTYLAANSDLIRNYAGFVKGWNYELNNGQLKLIFDDNIKPKNIEGNYIDNEIYEASCSLNLSDKFLNTYANRPSIFVYSKSDIVNKPINAYADARNKAIVKGLNMYYLNKKQQNIKGKLLFQKVLYNSLDNPTTLQNQVIYIVKFSIVN